MEFGAIQCTPVAPDCLFCPLQQECFAFLQGLVNVLPVKEKAKSSRQRFFHYLVLQHQDKLYLRKRPGNDIWQGLYDFFSLETDTLHPDPVLFQTQVQDALGSLEAPVQPTGKVYKHILSHQKILAQFYLIPLPARLRKDIAESIEIQLYSIQEIEDLPKPILIHSFLNEHFF
jgi:A/G-specific adenine glycosylase